AGRREPGPCFGNPRAFPSRSPDESSPHPSGQSGESCPEPAFLSCAAARRRRCAATGTLRTAHTHRREVRTVPETAEPPPPVGLGRGFSSPPPPAPQPVPRQRPGERTG